MNLYPRSPQKTFEPTTEWQSKWTNSYALYPIIPFAPH